LLIQTGAGNILWDCISLLDGVTFEHIRTLGGVAAICISHPHYYTTMVEWSRAFANAPIYLHGDDAEWVMRPDSCIHFWNAETKTLPGGVTAIRCGGHFPGGTVLHWPGGAGNKGVLLSGDIIQVVPDRRSVSFMWSYPNYIPLNAASVERIVRSVEPYDFDRIYGAFPKLTIASRAKESVRRSAERYLKAIR
jgi:glyoxylase-like metal-dependent hydrolase (beta-lactamase superfamily II)